MLRIACLTLTVLLAASAGLPAGDWPQWRGPEGNGISRDTGLPITWSERSGVAWKCDLPEWGNSTPIISGDAIFLTSHTDDNKLLLVRIDKAKGQIVWTREVGQGEAVRQVEGRGAQKFHDTQNLASASVATDGELLAVHFGNGDLAVYDLAGRQLWRRNLQEDFGRFTIWWGRANSPVIHGDLVISVCMQDSLLDLQEEASPSYLVAHHKRTGQRMWKQSRMTGAEAEECDSYTTPIFRQAGGRTEMIVWGGQTLDAYDPATGRRLWWLDDLGGNRVITGPVAADDMIYITQGMRRALLAVRIGGDGERPREDIVWQYDDGTPDSPTPVVWADLLFLVTDNGIAKCLDAKTGHLQWKERLKGQYRASPIVAEQRVYFLNTEGLATVVSAAPRFDRLAENQLDDRTFASPATSGDRLYIRGRQWLYSLRK